MQRPAAESLIVAVAEMLKVDSATAAGRAEVMRLGVALLDLCGEVREEVARLPKQFHPDLLLADFAQIENAVDVFTLARHTNVEGLTKQINPAGHRGLELIDRYLHTERAQTLIPESARLELIDQVRALMADVDGTDELDQVTKEFVLIRLAAVERALLDALLTGTPGIERATEALVGSMHRRRDLWNQIKGTPLGERITKVGLALCFALGTVNGAPVLMPGDAPKPEDSQNQIQNDPFIDIENVKIEIGGSDNDVTVYQRDTEVVDGEIVNDGGQTDSDEKADN